MLTHLWGGNEDSITPVPPQMYPMALKITHQRYQARVYIAGARVGNIWSTELASYA